MNKKDYSKFSTFNKKQKNKKVEEPVEIVPEVNIPNVIEDPVEIVPEVIEETPEVIQLKEGIVNCNKLNVRIEPKKDGDILSIINRNDVVQILDDSDKEFYKVMISDNKEGYCMKKFIDIK
jgi:hypothetical protein